MKDVKAITAKLEAGVKELFNSERYAEYLRTLSRFHRYSANNCLLILLQRPDASRVAGYKAWQKMGRQVRKREKAITILAPCLHKKVEEVDGEEREITWTSFRPTSVFDVAQTDGEELPDICHDLSGSVDEYDVILRRLIATAPCTVSFEDIKDGSHGFFRKGGGIVVKAGMSEAQTVKTLVHEIAHAMLHDDGAEEAEAVRTAKEVQAESVAYTVCQYLGIETEDYSFGYIAGWAEGKDLKELQEGLVAIQSTAKKIIDGLSEEK